MQHLNKYLKNYKKLYQLYENGTVFTAVDTETTGISVSHCKIIEIGAVKFDKNGIISTWNTLVNPDCSIPPFISNLTHITDSMVQDYKTIDKYLYSFSEFLNDSVIIAHNAHFDMNFINTALLTNNFLPNKNKVIDTLQYSRTLLPDLQKHNLVFLAEYFSINQESAHRALDDAITCMELFKKLVEIKFS